jgi:hypothetical protein
MIANSASGKRFPCLLLRIPWPPIFVLTIVLRRSASLSYVHARGKISGGLMSHTCTQLWNV